MADAKKIVSEIAKWLPVAWQLRDIFGGNKQEALRTIRKVAMERRAARDARMKKRRGST